MPTLYMMPQSLVFNDIDCAQLQQIISADDVLITSNEDKYRQTPISEN